MTFYRNELPTWTENWYSSDIVKYETLKLKSIYWYTYVCGYDMNQKLQWQMTLHWDNKLVLFLVFTIVCEVRSRLMSHFVKNREDEVGVECSCCFKFRKLFLKNAPGKNRV